jgi:hypothetical protein
MGTAALNAFGYLDTRETARREYLLLGDFGHNSKTLGLITAKKGFSTNYASIDCLQNIMMALFFVLLASYGDKSATIHDWLYSGYGVVKEDGTVYYPTREECDKVLYNALLDEGVGKFRAWIFYAGVRIGGSKHYTNGPAVFVPEEILVA